MACNGITVLRAQTSDVNLAEHFEDDTNRQAFLEFLNERGIETERARWRKSYKSWRLELARMSLTFTASSVSVSGSRRSTSDKQRAQQLLAAQQYAGTVNQMEVLAAIQALGIQTQNFSYDTAGSLSFEINL